MTLSMIVAMDKKGLIGRNNDLPWSLPEDLNYFKRTTTGKTVVMGRKTYESLKRLLPQRKNIILTRNENLHVDGATVLTNISEVLKLAETGDVFVIGGKEIYELLFPYVTTCYITHVENEYAGDTFLSLNLQDFIEISREKGLKNEKNNEDYFYTVYTREKTFNKTSFI